MNIKLRSFHCIAILCFSCFTAFAQQASTATGGNHSGAGGTISYSVGQVLYTTQTGFNGTESQGVQQPYEIMIITGADNINTANIQLLAYPNPTTDNLTIKVNSTEQQNLIFELYDINGKLLDTKTIKDQETQIDMKTYPPASYLLKINSEQKEIKVFKIIKN